MKPDLKDATRTWLQSERQGVDAEAEAALSSLFRALPIPAPSQELARRTLEQLERVAVAARRPHWAFRWAVAAALALSGMVVALFEPGLPSAASLRGGANWIVDFGAGMLASLFRRFATGYTFWDGLARAGGTAAEILATPQTLAVMLATVFFGLATFRVLVGLVAFERSSNHA